MPTTLSNIEGNRQALDGGAMFGNVPRAVWETWATPDAKGRIPLSCRALLIEHNGLRILCETGIGAFFAPENAGALWRRGRRSPPACQSSSFWTRRRRY